MHGENLIIGRQHEHALKCANRNVLLGYHDFALAKKVKFWVDEVNVVDLKYYGSKLTNDIIFCFNQ